MKNSASLIFTDEQVAYLRATFKEKPFSIRGKSRELGIKNHIYLSWALSGKTYSHVPNPVDPATFLKGGKTKTTPWTVKPRRSTKAPTPKVEEKPKDFKLNRLELIKAAAKKLKL